MRLDLLELIPTRWDRVLGINLRGPYFLTQAIARTMVDLIGAGTIHAPQIHFITSVSSTFANVNRGEYCVAKVGLSMVAQLVAARLAEHGINVNEIRPGIIATDVTAPSGVVYDRRIAEGLTPIRRWGTPGDVGRSVAAFAGGSLPYSTGEGIHVDVGLNLRRLCANHPESFDERTGRAGVSTLPVHGVE